MTPAPTKPSALDDYMMRARIDHDRSCPRWERPLLAGIVCDCSAYDLPVAARAELASMRDELDDWRNSAKQAASEGCGDERHCTCVGVLRNRLALADRLAEAAKPAVELIRCWLDDKFSVPRMNREDFGRMVHETRKAAGRTERALAAYLASTGGA